MSKGENYEPEYFPRDPVFTSNIINEHTTNQNFARQFTPSMLKIYANMSKDRSEEAEAKEMISITKTQFWVGIFGTIISILVVVCGATWTISNNINDKVSQSRQEVMGAIQMGKTEVNTRIDRVETKVDSGFKETASGLSDIKILLASDRGNKPKD
ncbi:TPA: hypothetical protein ACPZJO_003310 [Yersinia enterocolitica]|uniref:hypothetical protein n=1 Tax=Yersinia enterocolitica TaxID=630 RepID=UPI001C60CCE8|nr:hypothetical protein [Yersinia enterocolitica]EKN4877961.1 hypothetical protein [Yersinia enterocolitica]EKN5964968.1 hypothetical protein [Yersinia enterocolitica]EKN6107310.1 hypothetical protein [Yersinia enterocolitica]EKN6145189.1 hypothetical protein [Yersinia enterocolitica]ELZ0587361.1 hypothetical protein [Yersinia enterocolitica]